MFSFTLLSIMSDQNSCMVITFCGDYQIGDQIKRSYETSTNILLTRKHFKWLWNKFWIVTILNVNNNWERADLLIVNDCFIFTFILAGKQFEFCNKIMIIMLPKWTTYRNKDFFFFLIDKILKFYFPPPLLFSSNG